jgi:hypothetical protein
MRRILAGCGGPIGCRFWRILWLGIGLVLVVPVGYVGYLLISTELSRRAARSALHQVVPDNAKIVREQIYSCNTDDGGLPMCGSDYVVLPGAAGPEWVEAIRNELLAHGYHLLGDGDVGAGRWDIDAVRGKDEIYAIIPDAAGRKTCFDDIATPAKTYHIDPRRDAWECAAMLAYDRNIRPKTHL